MRQLKTINKLKSSSRTWAKLISKLIRALIVSLDFSKTSLKLGLLILTSKLKSPCLCRCRTSFWAASTFGMILTCTELGTSFSPGWVSSPTTKKTISVWITKSQINHRTRKTSTAALLSGSQWQGRRRWSIRRALYTITIRRIMCLSLVLNWRNLRINQRQAKPSHN